MKMTIENFFRTLLAAAFAVGLAREAFAASPGELHYQGKVTSSAGVPIPDGTVPVVFSLWDADTGGSQIGADISLPAVPVVNGVFSADFTPPLSSIQNNATVYLEVKVNGKTFNSPRRQKLVATAFALSIAADSVRTAEIKNGEVALIDMNTADVDTRYGTLGTVQTFTAAKTFSAAPSFSAAGSPFAVTNTGLVANLNADLLDGQTGSFYQSATNLTAGTLPNARVDGSSVTKMGNSFNGNGELVKFGAGTTNYPAGDGSAITNVNATGIANNAVDTNKIANGEVALIDMNTADVDIRYGTLGTVQTFTAAKTFSAAPSFSAVGSPFAVTNSGLVPNLNADLLDGQSGSFYQDAGNLNAGTIPSARIDSSSVTKMGNAFNGNNNLLQLGATGLIPNSLVDSSSVTKLGSVVNTSNGLLQLGGTGLIPNNVVDGSSITKMGNSFNGNNNLLQLGATGLVPNSAVDGSSITKMGNSFNGQQSAPVGRYRAGPEQRGGRFFHHQNGEQFQRQQQSAPIERDRAGSEQRGGRFFHHQNGEQFQRQQQLAAVGRDRAGPEQRGGRFFHHQNGEQLQRRWATREVSRRRHHLPRRERFGPDEPHGFSNGGRGLCHRVELHISRGQQRHGGGRREDCRESDGGVRRQRHPANLQSRLHL
ncbi:MAG: hypothetical protein IPP68_03840 [Elusimicrobia bacterium]|nr:hypothetical protein [Elusimicrobiota bacterium]